MRWRSITLTILLIAIWPAVKCFAATNYLWIGVTNSDWNTSSNWSPSGVPTSADNVFIGTSALTPNLPTVASGKKDSCANVTIGTYGLLNNVIKLTVNGSLYVSNTITQNPNALLGNVTSTLAGTGTITCAAIQAGNTTTFLNLGLTLLTNNVLQFVSTVNLLHVTGNVNIGSSAFFVLFIDLENQNSIFSVQGGTTVIDGQIVTATAFGGLLPIGAAASAYSKFSIDIPSGSAQTPTVKLTNATPINTASMTGSVDFYNNTGGTGTSTVIYGGSSAQTVYTESSTLIDKTPSVYQNIGFTGSGVKNIQSGTLSVWGNWRSAVGKVDALTNSPSAYFEGTNAETLRDSLSNSGAGVVFGNVYFQGGNTKTIDTGSFSIASIGVLNMANTTALNIKSSGNLTLISDSLSTATVAAIPAGCKIYGSVNVQRFIQGSWTSLAKRGYRLVSSCVYTDSVTTPKSNKVFNIRYLLNNTYLSGPAGGGFNAPNGTNPTAYLFREDIVPSNSAFTSGNWKGIDKINNSPLCNIGTQARLTKTNIADTTTVLPVGNGFIFYFIGNQSNNSSQTGSKTSPPFDYPESVVFTQVGKLNTGTVNVRLWFRPDSTLSFTNMTGNSGVRGFCLLGNPYASTINWEKFNRASTLANSSIYGVNYPAASATPQTIWMFNQKSKQYDTYQQKSGTVDTVSAKPSINRTGSATNMIASGQGFFIKATATNQSISFRETAKTNTQPIPTGIDSMLIVQKPTSLSQQISAVAEPSLHLKLEKDSVNVDEIVVAFDKNGNNNFNPWDAEDMGGIGPQVSLSAMSADSVKLAIHTIPLPIGTAATIIPLLVTATTTGLYTLDLSALNNLPSNYQVWLRDNYLKDSLNIGTAHTYVFNLNLSDANSYGTGRFCLVVRENPADINQLLTFSGTKVSGTAVLKWHTSSVYDISSFNIQRSTDNGKTFTTINTVSGGNTSYVYTDSNPFKGLNIYRLQYTVYEQEEFSNTASLDFSSANNSNVAVTLYPNPTTSLINVKINDNRSDDYTIMLLNSSGVVINRTNLTNTSWQYNATNLVPGTYLISVYDNKVGMPVGTSKFIKL